MRGSCCGQKPSTACARSGLLSTLCPSTRASPLVGCVRPVSIPSIVVLPAEEESADPEQSPFSYCTSLAGKRILALPVKLHGKK